MARGTAAAAALLVAIVGASLVFVEAGESPSPPRALTDARNSLSASPSVRFTGAVAVSDPTGPGTTTVERRSIQGVVARDGSQDWMVQRGSAASEFRSLAGQPGVWVRVAASSQDLASAQWVHAHDLEAYEQAALASEGSGQANSVARAVLVDRLSSGAGLVALVAGAMRPRRLDHHARQLAVGYDARGVSPELGASQPSGQIRAGGDGHVREVTVRLSMETTTVEAGYTTALGRAVSITAPPPDTVTSEV